MINKKSIQTIEKKGRFSKQFLKPLYDSYNLVKVIEIIKYLFGINKKTNFPLDLIIKEKKPLKVIVFFIDGFGWQFIEKFKNHPFFNWAIKKGVLSKLTSQFPSTTIIHLNLFHTGTSVGEVGIYGWHDFESSVNPLLNSVLFSNAKINLKTILPNSTFYQFLKKNHVDSFIFQPQEYTTSTYCDHFFQGATVFPYKTLSEAITILFSVFEKIKHPSYFFLYFDRIDSLAHQYGPNSSQIKNEILTFLSIIEKIFIPLFEKNHYQTVFLMTADHGYVEVNPNNCFYINKETKGILKYLKINQKGEYLVPAGSPRDMFLHVKEEHLEKTKKILEKKLQGKGEVFLTEDLIKKQFFGKKTSETFLSRVGNLVVLPYKNQTVWWYEKEKFEMKDYGLHGGLSKEEMEVGLIFI